MAEAPLAPIGYISEILNYICFKGFVDYPSIIELNTILYRVPGLMELVNPYIVIF